MKKIITGILSAAAIAALCLCMAACGPADVSGKTYNFSDFQLTFSEEVPEDVRKMYTPELIAGMKKGLEGGYVTFNADGTCFQKQGEREIKGVWKQEGNKVYVGSEAADLEKENCSCLELSGDTLIMSQTSEGITSKMIFKRA